VSNFHVYPNIIRKFVSVDIVWLKREPLMQSLMIGGAPQFFLQVRNFLLPLRQL